MPDEKTVEILSDAEIAEAIKIIESEDWNELDAGTALLAFREVQARRRSPSPQGEEGEVGRLREALANVCDAIEAQMSSPQNKPPNGGISVAVRWARNNALLVLEAAANTTAPVDEAGKQVRSPSSGEPHITQSQTPSTRDE